MAETVNVLGRKMPKSYVIAGAAGVAGIVGYAYMTRAPSDPGYLTEADVDMMGDERITPTTIDTYDVSVDQRQGARDNAEWHQNAVAYLSGLGYDQQVVSTAVGLFLARKTLDKVQAQIVIQAVGSQGEPPEGRPWYVLETQNPASTGLLAPANFRAIGGASSAQLSWDAVTGATKYQTRLRGFAWKDVTGTTETVPFPAGAQGTYTFDVRGVNAAGVAGPESSATAVITRGPGGPPSSSGAAKGSAGAGTFESPKVYWSRTRTTIRLRAQAAGSQKYYVSRSGGGRGVMHAPMGLHVSTGLRPNTAYTFTVRAAKGRRPREQVAQGETVVTIRTAP